MQTCTTLQTTNDCIFGTIGFSITSDTLTLLTNSIVTYCFEENISHVIIGYDASDWTKKFADEVILPRLCQHGIQGYYIDTPCPLFQLSWLTKQCYEDAKRQHRHLGIYLTTDVYYHDKLSLQFRDTEGKPFSEEEISKLIQHSPEITYKENNVIEPLQPQPLDITLYWQYLQDKSLINLDTVKSTRVYIDTMFGASEKLVTDLFKVAELKGGIINKASEPPRLKNYIPAPTGKFLQWYVPMVSEINPDSSSKTFFFGLSHDGSRLGVWDLKQDLEISTSGLFMILLYHFAKIQKKRGTILISKAMSQRVETVAKNLDLEIERIDSGTDSFLQAVNKKRRRPILMYGNEFGGFWFKGDTLDINPAVSICKIMECCKHLDKSPGEIVDLITSKYLTKQYYYSNLMLPLGLISKKEVENKLLLQYTLVETLDDGFTSVANFTNNSRVAVQENLKQYCVEVFLESEEKQTAEEMSTYLQSLFTRNEDEET